MRHEREALYDRLQLTSVSPQEKMRYRRGAMLLCHLLRERDAVDSCDGSLLDRYLLDYYFSWSAAVNEQDDAFICRTTPPHYSGCAEHSTTCSSTTAGRRRRRGCS